MSTKLKALLFTALVYAVMGLAAALGGCHNGLC